MNIFFLPLELCQSQLSMETQSENNLAQQIERVSYNNFKKFWAYVPVYTIKI